MMNAEIMQTSLDPSTIKSLVRTAESLPEIWVTLKEYGFHLPTMVLSHVEELRVDNVGLKSCQEFFVEISKEVLSNQYEFHFFNRRDEVRSFYRSVYLDWLAERSNTLNTVDFVSTEQRCLFVDPAYAAYMTLEPQDERRVRFLHHYRERMDIESEQCRNRYKELYRLPSLQLTKEVFKMNEFLSDASRSSKDLTTYTKDLDRGTVLSCSLSSVRYTRRKAWQFSMGVMDSSCNSVPLPRAAPIAVDHTTLNYLLPGNYIYLNYGFDPCDKVMGLIVMSTFAAEFGKRVVAHKYASR